VKVSGSGVTGKRLANHAGLRPHLLLLWAAWKMSKLRFRISMVSDVCYAARGSHRSRRSRIGASGASIVSRDVAQSVAMNGYAGLQQFGAQQRCRDGSGKTREERWAVARNDRTDRNVVLVYQPPFKQR
jgi:hypothetical protein